MYFFGVGDMGLAYNLLALAIRMASGAIYAMVLVKPIAHGLARAGVLRGTAVAEADVARPRRGLMSPADLERAAPYPGRIRRASPR